MYIVFAYFWRFRLIQNDSVAKISKKQRATSYMRSGYTKAYTKVSLRDTVNIYPLSKGIL